MKLFCIPYAGGSSTVYYKWNNYLPETVNVVPVDYKGHGRRFAEELSLTMEDVVEDLFHRIIQNFDGEEYSFYGHMQNVGSCFCSQSVSLCLFIG